MKKYRILILFVSLFLLFSCVNENERKACTAVENLLLAGKNNDLDKVKSIAPFVNKFSKEEQDAFLAFLSTWEKQKKSIVPENELNGIFFVNLTIFDFETGNKSNLIFECILDESCEKMIVTENFSNRTQIQYLDYVNLEDLK
ncbi:MAG: hypothetical protein ACTTHG_06520 [Treponemataceae bacterium]